MRVQACPTWEKYRRFARALAHVTPFSGGRAWVRRPVPAGVGTGSEKFKIARLRSLVPACADGVVSRTIRRSDVDVAGDSETVFRVVPDDSETVVPWWRPGLGNGVPLLAGRTW
jgi:hypothetical protein